jgi:hypothetical protein
MKIRTGFVSSSSFVIYGIRLTKDQINYLLKKYKVDTVDELPRKFGDVELVYSSDDAPSEKINYFLANWISPEIYGIGEYDLTCNDILKIKESIYKILDVRIEPKLIVKYNESKKWIH